MFDYAQRWRLRGRERRQSPSAQPSPIANRRQETITRATATLTDQAAERGPRQAQGPEQIIGGREALRQADPLGVLLIRLESVAPEVAHFRRHAFHYLETEQRAADRLGWAVSVLVVFVEGAAGKATTARLQFCRIWG